MKNTIEIIASYAFLTGATAVFGMETAAGGCFAQSGATRTPVIELYTSEGCSSCPPADKWLSTLKTAGTGKAASEPVVQAFHVGYWDYIGWVDRFASPANTARQRQIASFNRQSSIYTPQAVLDGRDWRDWGRVPSTNEPPGAAISLKQVGPDQFEALVTPLGTVQDGPGGTAGSGGSGGSTVWSAYWSVTEHGHSSKVKAGENAGELLQHDFVVRQYTPVGSYRSDAKAPQKLTWRSIAATPGHARQINLVVFDPRSGRPLQAVSVGC